MEQPPHQPSSEHQDAQGEQMVPALRMSTVFSESAPLERIADALLEQGRISGFSVEPIRAGYTYRGVRVREDQFLLNILVPETSTEEDRRALRDTMAQVIGERWDVPKLEEERVLVNERLLGFIQRVGIEHQKFVHERRLRLSFMLAALLGVAGVVGAAVQRYGERRAEAAVATEQERAYQKLSSLSAQVEHRVRAIEHQLGSGHPLTESPSDMAVQAGYEETHDVIQLLRDAEHELRTVVESKPTP